jgi:hypothetical protein
VYAVVGPFSSGRSRILETFQLDEDRVEYAQINYKVMAQKPTPVDDEANFNAEGKQNDNNYYLLWPSIILLVGDDFICITLAESDSLNLDSLLIHLKDQVTEKWHQFGVALGVEKEILDRCLNYPPEQSIVEILDHWLRSGDVEDRNWKDVARALRQIEHHQLAKEIENIDKTGHDLLITVTC